MRPLATFVAIAASLSVSGCCNLARYFCGPDSSEWVSVGYATPKAALATFREAVRRADKVTIARSLSEGFRSRTGLIGVLDVAIVWERLEEEHPGLHMLGYAEAADRRDLAPDRVEYVLEVAGRRILIGLVRQPYWEVYWVYGGDPDDLQPQSAYLETIREHADVRYDEQEFQTNLTIRLPPIDAAVEAGQIQRAGVGFEWKVDVLEEASTDDAAPDDDS